MRQLVIAAAAGAFLGSSALAAQKVGAAQEIQAAEQAMARAAAARDAGAYGKFLTNDFTWTDRMGNVRTRAEVLQNVAPDNPADKVSEEQCSVYGTAAVCTGARYLAEPKVNVRYLRAWVKTGGQWQIAAHQGVTITPPSETPATPAAAPAADTTAATPPPPATVTGAAEKEILDALNALGTANATANSAAFAQLVTDDFIGISPQGQTRTKAARLEQIKTATPREARPFAGRDLRIRFHGNLAVVTWRSGADGRTHNMAPMVKEKGRWLRAGVIATTMPATGGGL